MAKKAQLDEVRPILDEVNDGITKVDTVIDAVEESVDKGVHAVAETTREGIRAFQSPRRMIITFGLAGALIGAGAGVAGYFLLKKRMEKKLRDEFEARLEDEIEGMRNFYMKRASKRQPYSSPEEALEALHGGNPKEEKLVDEAAEALAQYEGPEPPPGIISSENDPRQGVNHRVRYDKVGGKDAEPKVETEVKVEEVRTNVFVQQASLDDWDQEHEEAERNPESPYVISHDEFMGSELDDQRSLTYYAGDDILADEREVPIDEVEATVGVLNLQRFGHGSRDSSVVYVRNERIEVDFEITRRPGSYADEVMGELQHADIPRLRKGRRDDGG